MVPGDRMCSPGCQLPVCAGARPRVVACGELQPREVRALRGGAGQRARAAVLSLNRGVLACVRLKIFSGALAPAGAREITFIHGGAREKKGPFFTAFWVLKPCADARRARVRIK